MAFQDADCASQNQDEGQEERKILSSPELLSFRILVSGQHVQALLLQIRKPLARTYMEVKELLGKPRVQFIVLPQQGGRWQRPFEGNAHHRFIEFRSRLLQLLQLLLKTGHTFFVSKPVLLFPLIHLRSFAAVARTRAACFREALALRREPATTCRAQRPLSSNRAEMSRSTSRTS